MDKSNNIELSYIYCTVLNANSVKSKTSNDDSLGFDDVFYRMGCTQR